MRAHTVGLVANYEVDVVNTGVNQSVEDVFEDRSSTGR
jgi:hypothetical protein